MSKDDLAALVAAFDNAQTNDAEHDAALALRDYVAGLIDDAGELDLFPMGEGFGDFDVDPRLYTRPRHVLEGRAELQMARVPSEAALAREAQIGVWAWSIMGLIVVAALLYLLAFGPQARYPMDSDSGPAPVSVAR